MVRQAFRFCGSLSGKSEFACLSKKVPVLNYLDTAIEVVRAGLSVWKLYQEKERTAKLKEILSGVDDKQTDILKGTEETIEQKLENKKILSKQKLCELRGTLKRKKEMLDHKYKSKIKKLESDNEVKKAEEEILEFTRKSLAKIIESTTILIEKLKGYGEQENENIAQFEEQMRLAGNQYAKILKITMEEK